MRRGECGSGPFSPVPGGEGRNRRSRRGSEACRPDRPLTLALSPEYGGEGDRNRNAGSRSLRYHFAGAVAGTATR